MPSTRGNHDFYSHGMSRRMAARSSSKCELGVQQGAVNIQGKKAMEAMP